MTVRLRFISKAMLCGAGLLLTGLALHGQNISAKADVSPEVVMEGVSAEYTITIVNSSRLPDINTPRIEGLDFDDTASTSSFRQIVNGRASIETRASWSFEATRTGSFTIPGRTLRISGEEVRVPPVSFEVVPMGEETRSRAFLQLEVTDGPYFVGQAIPAKLGLFVRNDLSLANIAFPERDGDAFLNGEFDNNPRRSRVRLKGRIYESFVWDFILTPIKAGPATLQFSQQVAVQIPVSDNSMPSIFNLRRSRTEELTLRSDLIETNVRQLPEEDRPDSFSDAVGEFDITADLSSRDLQVGEPITLTLALEGQGNFDRMAPPELGDWENWRVYQPQVEFTPSDEVGHEGRKVFEYILIPRSPAIEEIPEIAVSSFNPEARAYETTIIEAEPVTVKPSDTPLDSRSFSFDEEDNDTSGTRIPESLLPIRPNVGFLTPSGS
ncbi:MAG: BatD family protein, partial [Oceanipulchritudo sp.]